MYDSILFVSFEATLEPDAKNKYKENYDHSK